MKGRMSLFPSIMAFRVALRARRSSKWRVFVEGTHGGPSMCFSPFPFFGDIDMEFMSAVMGSGSDERRGGSLFLRLRVGRARVGRLERVVVGSRGLTIAFFGYGMFVIGGVRNHVIGKCGSSFIAVIRGR